MKLTPFLCRRSKPQFHPSSNIQSTFNITFYTVPIIHYTRCLTFIDHLNISVQILLKAFDSNVHKRTSCSQDHLPGGDRLMPLPASSQCSSWLQLSVERSAGSWYGSELDQPGNGEDTFSTKNYFACTMYVFMPTCCQKTTTTTKRWLGHQTHQNQWNTK